MYAKTLKNTLYLHSISKEKSKNESTIPIPTVGKGCWGICKVTWNRTKNGDAIGTSFAETRKIVCGSFR
jgi:hypothetical protein